jgi:hypothetical protein
MEVGKRYQYHKNPNHTYECLLILKSGNAVLRNINPCRTEFVVSLNNFVFYNEVREPEVRYVYWYRHEETDEIIAVIAKTLDGKMGDVWVHLKTDKVTCDA